MCQLKLFKLTGAKQCPKIFYSPDLYAPPVVARATKFGKVTY